MWELISGMHLMRKWAYAEGEEWVGHPGMRWAYTEREEWVVHLVMRWAYFEVLEVVLLSSVARDSAILEHVCCQPYVLVAEPLYVPGGRGDGKEGKGWGGG